MAEVNLWSGLRQFTDGELVVRVEANTVGKMLDELRLCPPAPGSSGVQIPGERERIQRESSQNILQIPVSTWDQICDLASKYGVST